METFPRSWPFLRGVHRSPVNSADKGQWRGALMFSLLCARIYIWVNNREAGDLRCHRAHCDVIVMWLWYYGPSIEHYRCQKTNPPLTFRPTVFLKRSTVWKKLRPMTHNLHMTLLNIFSRMKMLCFFYWIFTESCFQKSQLTINISTLGWLLYSLRPWDAYMRQ